MLHKKWNKELFNQIKVLEGRLLHNFFLLYLKPPIIHIFGSMGPIEMIDVLPGRLLPIVGCLLVCATFPSVFYLPKIVKEKAQKALSEGKHQPAGRMQRKTNQRKDRKKTANHRIQSIMMVYQFTATPPPPPAEWMRYSSLLRFRPHSPHRGKCGPARRVVIDTDGKLPSGVPDRLGDLSDKVRE